MIITRSGDKGEGKSMMAKKIVSSSSFNIIENSMLKNRFWTKYIDNCDFLIIDEFVHNQKVIDMFKNKFIEIEQQAKPIKKIKTPNLILINKTL